MMILLGKHQFMVSSIDETGNNEISMSNKVNSIDNNSNKMPAIMEDKSESKNDNNSACHSGLTKQTSKMIGDSNDNVVLVDLISKAEEFGHLITDLNVQPADTSQVELKAKLSELNDKLNLHISSSKKALLSNIDEDLGVTGTI